MSKIIKTMYFIAPIINAYAGTIYTQKYDLRDKDGYELTQWEVIIPEEGITKINNNTYMYAYKAIPTNEKYFTYRGLNLLDINKNKAIECITASDSPFLDFTYKKCSLNNTHIQVDDNLGMNKMLKKIIKQQCILIKSPYINNTFKTYDCNN